MILTETCSAGEVSLVEVLVVDGDRLDERGAHAHHGLAVLAPAIKKDKRINVTHSSQVELKNGGKFRMFPLPKLNKSSLLRCNLDYDHPTFHFLSEHFVREKETRVSSEADGQNS